MLLLLPLLTITAAIKLNVATISNYDHYYVASQSSDCVALTLSYDQSPFEANVYRTAETLATVVVTGPLYTSVNCPKPAVKRIDNVKQ